MSASQHFCLNGLIDLHVEGPARYRRFFVNEYARMDRAPIRDERPSVTLKVCDRITRPNRRETVYNNLFRFAYAVEGLETGSPVLHFERHWLEWPAMTALGSFIQGQLLEPLIYIKLAEAGILFMHAAGVAKEGKAYVFPAHGGTGKTTLALSLTRQGFELMGDDLLMIEADSGRVHAFARPLHLFTYNLKSLKVPLPLEMVIRSKDVVRFALNVLSRRKFLIATRAHVEDLMDVRFGTSAQLAKLVFLRREGETETLDLADEAQLALARDRVLESADLNGSFYANIVDDPSYRACEAQLVEEVIGRLDEMTFINARAMNGESDREAFGSSLITAPA
ncbi:hypothetical protein [Aurantiacibacter sediminis]|uniref:Serine kinase n=1 Tax=Aurantiacibacter sediminis TaxID=2793064 RepID=A0ABS0N5F7_9SPHN|nr:hypothetical protein [Aurantiacibacter sediminis]MBH5323026.1 hypothetical protein [Aurantiacibacter sediminis]